MNGKMMVNKAVKIEARPESIEIDLSRIALIIVDMQNVFAGRAEYSGIFKDSVKQTIRAIEQTKKLADAARTAGVTVIYLRMMKDPERKGKSIIRSPQDTEIVDELTPLPGDIIVEKLRYSGFRETVLDEILKSRNITHLIFTGTATNICVESTLRDAYFLDYYPILVSDATSSAGPSVTYEATLWNVEEVFGWVAATDDVINALNQK